MIYMVTKKGQVMTGDYGLTSTITKGVTGKGYLGFSGTALVPILVLGANPTITVPTPTDGQIFTDSIATVHMAYKRDSDQTCAYVEFKDGGTVKVFGMYINTDETEWLDGTNLIKCPRRSESRTFTLAPNSKFTLLWMAKTSGEILYLVLSRDSFDLLSLETTSTFESNDPNFDGVNYPEHDIETDLDGRYIKL